MNRLFTVVLLLAAVGAAFAQTRPFEDHTHVSKVFGGERNYRLFLPKGYAESTRRYPVIYYFHGHSDRYTLEHYDQGKDTVPKIAQFTAEQDAIVVSVDGYVARDYTGFYGGTPWDVRENGGDFDFGLYFQELVRHVDASYRTLTDRRHRATSGLSMGGFMSLWLSARLPDLIGSASAFNPGPEFFAGDKGTRMLWRPKDHVPSHQHTMIRLVRASGDYISQYHEETRDAYAASSVPFEYRVDEYHRHWATSIGETFAFHVKAFTHGALNNTPTTWSYASPYQQFDVWGYQVQASGAGKAMVYLEDVTQCGMRIRTRRWAPDGPAGDRKILVRTAPLYEPGVRYVIVQRGLSAAKTERVELTAGSDGRLEIPVDGAGYQLGISGPGCGAEAPVLLPLSDLDVLRVKPGETTHLPLRLFNPRSVAQKGLKVRIASDYPTVDASRKEIAIPELGPGEVIDVGASLPVKFTAGDGEYARVSINVTVVFDDWHNARQVFPVLIEPENIPQPVEYEVMDGRTRTFAIFRQKGNQGGGSVVEQTVTEGTGNGNGILEKGETATIWVKIPQGLDPFDKGNWHRAKVRADGNRVEEVEDIQEEKQREWTGAKERTNVIRWRADTPQGQSTRLILDVASWSFHYTPDVRYGVERLYQAFQLHKRHLYQMVLRTP